MPDNLTIRRPNFGLYLDRPAIDIPARAIQDCRNVRIKEGTISNVNMGWDKFMTRQLNGPVTLIDNFFLSSGAQILIFGTPTDLYKYDEGSGDVVFITPILNTGTVDVSADDPAVVTTDTGTPNFVTNGAKSGDEISFGDNAENDPDATWYTIDSVDDADTLTLTTTVAGAPLAAQAYTLRRLFQADLLHPWESTTFVNDTTEGSDLWFATNGVDYPIYWNGTDTFATLFETLGFTCFSLAVYRNMMIYANIAEDGGDVLATSIVNSDVGDATVVDGTGLSGQFVVHDGTDEIVGMTTMGDSLVIYSSRNAKLVQFVGGDLVFVFRSAFDGLGPIGPRLIADFGDFHEFVGSDAKYSFDGVTLSEVGSQAWREIIRQRDPTRPEAAFAHFDEENGDLVWAIPLTSDAGSGDTSQGPEVGWGEHYLEDMPQGVGVPITFRDFPFSVSGYFERQSTLTWADISQTWAEINFRWNDQFFSSAFPFNLVGDEDGYVYTLNTSQNRDDGTALASHATFGRLPIGTHRMRALIRRIYPFVTKNVNADVTITVFLSNQAEGPAETTLTFTFSQLLSQEANFVSVFRRARYATVKFGTDGPSETFELAGYDIDLTAGGYR